MPRHYQPPHCILVIDDEKNYRILLKRLLEGAGYAVLTTEDPARALELLRREHIALVISDLCMPAANGSGFCKAVVSEFAAIPCIVFTAYASRRTEAILKAAGVSGWLSKPFANQQMLDLVAAVLAGQRPGGRFAGPSGLGHDSAGEVMIPVTGEGYRL